MCSMTVRSVHKDHTQNDELWALEATARNTFSFGIESHFGSIFGSPQFKIKSCVNYGRLTVFVARMLCSSKGNAIEI